MHTYVRTYVHTENVHLFVVRTYVCTEILHALPTPTYVCTFMYKHPCTPTPTRTHLHTLQPSATPHLSLSARSIVFSAAVSLYSVLPSSVTISRPERYSASSSSSSLTRLRSAPSCWLAWSWLTVTCSKGVHAIKQSI